MEFEKRVTLELKLLGVAVGVLAVICSIHTLLLIS